MKKLLLFTTLILCSLRVFPQSQSDSLSAFLKSFHLSMEFGYNFLIPSATEYDSYYSPGSTEVHNPFSLNYAVWNPWRDTSYSHFQHHQFCMAIAAESKIVKWRLSARYDNLDYSHYSTQFQADHLRLALALQFYIIKKDRIHILFGSEVELGWIMRYAYSSGSVMQRNPDIGQKTGCDLLFPLSIFFPISQNSKLYIQIASGLHLRNDHELPYMSHWGAGPGPEAGLLSYCPLSIGVGYSLMLNK